MSSVQLLDRTRKIGKLLHNNNSSKVVFNDICQVLTEILDSNILVISRKGKVLGVSLCPGVEEIKELGSHHMFIAKVMAVQVSEEYMNETGKFCLNETGLLAYSHGEYLGLGKTIGTFGYSVKKKKKRKK